MSQITCIRCHASKASLEKAPLPTPLGQKLWADVCADCWGDWKKNELMLINEYRLNMMDKEHRGFLTKQMKVFFGYEAAAAAEIKNTPVSG